jgi:hypothetical protein
LIRLNEKGRGRALGWGYDRLLTPPDVGAPRAGGGGFGSGSGSTGGEIATWVNQHFSAVTVDGVTIYDLTAPSS